MPIIDIKKLIDEALEAKIATGTGRTCVLSSYGSGSSYADPAYVNSYVNPHYVCPAPMPAEAHVDRPRLKPREKSIPAIDHYKVFDKTVVVWFADGSKEVAVCDENDTFDLTAGIMVCINKKLCGQNIVSQVERVIRKQERLERDEALALLKLEEEKVLAEEKRRKEKEKALKQQILDEIYREKLKVELKAELEKKAKAKKSGIK